MKELAVGDVAVGSEFAQTTPSEPLYRAMKRESDGRPAIGDNDLGVRTGFDITPDLDGNVGPGMGGMSASNDPHELPIHRRPPTIGGTSKKPVWITGSLSEFRELLIRPDSNKPSHLLVEPAHTMAFQQYRSHLSETRLRWDIAFDV